MCPTPASAKFTCPTPASAKLTCPTPASSKLTCLRWVWTEVWTWRVHPGTKQEAHGHVWSPCKGVYLGHILQWTERASELCMGIYSGHIQRSKRATRESCMHNRWDWSGMVIIAGGSFLAIERASYAWCDRSISRRGREERGGWGSYIIIDICAITHMHDWSMHAVPLTMHRLSYWSERWAHHHHVELSDPSSASCFWQFSLSTGMFVLNHW